MAKYHQGISADQALEWLAYDACTGIFTWKKTPRRGHVRAGDVAGTRKPDGYIAIGLLGALYKAHRLAWLMHYGSWPVHEIDHLNAARSDNRIENLRDATPQINQQKRRRSNKNNLASGMLGVYPSLKKWQAKIERDGKQRYLGTFDTAQLAHEAYLAAKRELHEGCTI